MKLTVRGALGLLLIEQQLQPVEDDCDIRDGNEETCFSVLFKQQFIWNRSGWLSREHDNGNGSL